MGSTTNTIKMKEQLQAEFQVLIKKRVDMLAWYARQLIKIFDFADYSLKISASIVDTSLFIEAINKLDDEFAKKESTFFNEYEQLINKYNILQPADKKEELDMAIARLKNKINIAVAFVSGKAKKALRQARRLNMTGKAVARLEYLSELTLEKQIMEFESILDSVIN